MPLPPKSKVRLGRQDGPPGSLEGPFEGNVGRPYDNGTVWIVFMILEATR